ncbi:MAG: hypothetical protein K2X82_09525, partial [Gemmataceae bacterium]|nr:hypothetical protein [Gemmataceae bacterium]
AADLAGAVAGGLLAGGAGVGFLVWSGSWPYYWDVLTNWNVTYVGIVLAGLESRIALQWRYFPPWSTLMVATLPLAAFNLLTDGRGRPAPGRPPGWLYLPADGRAGAARRALAAMFLGWTATAYVLQQPFPYIHLPETLLMLAVLAANGWGLAAPAALLVQAAGVAVLTVGPSVAGRPVPADRRERYVLGRLTQVADDHPNRLRWWAGCWSREVPPELRNGLAFRAGLYYDPDWVGLAEVADYLRGRGVRPGDADVLCWDTTPHVLYLDLGLRPPVRFLHVTTATEWGPGPTARVRDELAAAAPRVRLVVGDIKALSWRLKPVDQLQLSEPGVDLLPPLLPPEYRAVFPMNQRAVFRSAMGRGRYVVYELVNPVGEIDLPLPGAADTGKAG